MKSNHSFFIIFYTFKSLFPIRILACFTFFIFLKMRLKITENNEKNENFKRRELFFYKSDFYGFGGKKFLRFCRKKLPDEIFFTNVEAEIFKFLSKKYHKILNISASTLVKKISSDTFFLQNLRNFLTPKP